ncbi:hypothetical protein OUZ56_030682 [Daphnia magna]|uniref:Uncharacterized protein n=1 Tax=Daphnia magna TaxID=35525 RepID=A0ABQ9ZS02_9CRUS|nr:hypothetical protein OUZ56_030682 [Daphnia magna]
MDLKTISLELPIFGQQITMPSSSSISCKIDHQYYKFCLLRFIVAPSAPRPSSSSPRPSSVFASPVIVFASPVIVFASPVTPSYPSLPHPSPGLRLTRRPVFASPVSRFSPHPSPGLRLLVAPSSPLLRNIWYRCIL